MTVQSPSHLPESISAGIGTYTARGAQWLPRFRRAGPSTSLDKGVLLLFAW